jgi:hypothetical protein
MKSFAPSTLMFALAIAASGGCTKSEEALVPVTGRVLVDGKPAAGAAIAFHPADDTNGTHPVAQVDANGDFQLTTIRAGDGARPGDYRVTLTWYVSPPRKKGVEGEESPPRNLIPNKYARGESTPITATIRQECNEPIRIEISTRRQ